MLVLKISEYKNKSDADCSVILISTHVFIQIVVFFFVLLELFF